MHRAAITGVGVVTPAGLDLATTWDGVLAARSCAARITLFEPDPAAIGWACEVRDLDAEAVVGEKEARRTDRVAVLGLKAAQEALAQAGDLGADPARVSVVYGTGIGGLITLEQNIETRIAKGSRRVSPMLAPMLMPNATAGLVSLRNGFTGVAYSVATACASGTNAIGEGLRMIRDGSADVVVAGGTEAAITPTTMAGFGRMGALSPREEPTASRPFDEARDGFVMGEGAGCLVLERWDLAEARGATILGEVAGYGRTSDAHHITAPLPDGAGAVACMLQALADAGLTPADVAQVNAHGTSTPLNDAAEGLALAKVFGERGVPTSSTKGCIGHLIGGAGAVEAAVALHGARLGVVPPVAGTTTVDPALPVDVVLGDPRPVRVGAVLSNSFGFGGHNASVVLLPA